MRGAAERTIESWVHARALPIAALLMSWTVSAGAQEAPAPTTSEPAPTVAVTAPPTPGEQANAAQQAQLAPQPLPTPPSPVAAWIKGEGFRIQSPDGNWRLRIGIQFAAFYQPVFRDTGNNWSNFGLSYVRPHISGNLVRPWFEYWCSFEFNRFPPFLLDCMVDVRPWKFFGLRAGQFWTALSRHEYLGPQEVLFPDWSTTANYFWTGRDRGVQLFAETDYFDYYASLTAGTTLTQTASVPGNFQLIGRVDINPLGKMGVTEMPFVASEDPVPFRFSFALQGVWGRVNPNGVGFNSSAFLVLTQQGEREQGIGAADLLVQWGRFGFFGEFYGRRVSPIDVPTLPFTQYGAWAQAHYTFFRRALDFALRFDWIDPSTTLANDQFFAGEAQLAWFIVGTSLALRLRYAVGHQEDPGPAPAADPDFLTTVGLPITPGTAHLLTLQVQLAL